VDGNYISILGDKMEGVITYFNHDKGFGFIEGEDMERYFFHRDRISKVFFKLDENDTYVYSKYMYSDYKIDRRDPIFIIDFEPLRGKKGLIASELKETQKLMNAEGSYFKVKIIDLKFERFSISYYDNHPNYGAIARDYTSNVWLHYQKIGGYGKGKIDVRQIVLDINGRQKITEALVNNIKRKIIGMEFETRRNRFIPEKNNTDVVFHSQDYVYSVHQILLNHQKYEQELEKESLELDHNILRL
jgi:cold shock CspA family protein